MGSLSLLQRIFPAEGSNPGLPHCRQILYQLSHKGSPLRVRRGSKTRRSAQKAKEGDRPSHHLQSRVLTPSKCWWLGTPRRMQPGLKESWNTTLLFKEHLSCTWWFPSWLRWYSVCPQCGRPGFNPWVRKISWRRKCQPTPVFLPGKSHGWRSLVGYSPWGRKE